MTQEIVLGKIIKQRRKAISLTLRQLADMSGISASHLGRIEKEERFPSAYILKKIAEPLGFSVSELFVLAGFLSTPESDKEPETDIIWNIDYYVASKLAEEPIEIQRTVISILLLMKSLAKQTGISANKNSIAD